MIPVMEDKGNGRVPHTPELSHRPSLFLVRLVVEDKGNGRVPHTPELSHCPSLFLVRPVMKDEGDGRVPHTLEDHIVQPLLVSAVVPLGQISVAVAALRRAFHLNVVHTATALEPAHRI